jgi:hypothetical protein
MEFVTVEHPEVLVITPGLPGLGDIVFSNPQRTLPAAS